MVWNRGLSYKKYNSLLKTKKFENKGVKGKKQHNWKGGISRNYSYRLMRGKIPICDICRKETVVDIDHKDGNSENNKLSNLHFLCSSCHHKKDGRIKNIPKNRMGVNPSYFLHKEFDKFRNPKTGRFEKWG